jgi:general secretion pathway protein D
LVPLGVDDAALDACLAALDAATPPATRVWLIDDAQAGPRGADIVQEVSSADSVSTSCNGQACNPAISISKLKTEAAVQSGQTVMLAGLIDDQVEHGSSGIPGLSRIPVIGGLFGTQHTNKSRTETIILITPTIVRNPQEAADLTDEYSRRFRAMEPLHQPASNRK